jgi:GNAT superfamily N-acetyltransferase
MSVRLRPGDDGDLTAVGDLHYRSRRTAYAGILSPAALDFGSPDALGEWWRERVRWERDTHRLTVADQDGRLAGFTYLGVGEEPDTAELSAIHVEPDLVGTGVGRLLMIDALAALRAYGSSAVLWVLDGNVRAQRFYERGGWVFDGRVRDAPMGGETTRQLRYARSLADGSA